MSIFLFKTELSRWQNSKAWECEILFFTSLTPLSLSPMPFHTFSSRFSLSPILSHLFSVFFREAAPWNPAMSFWGTRQYSPAADAILRHCELRKRIWWQQVLLTLFCKGSKNCKCKGYWQTNGEITRLFTNAWDFKPPAWEREMDFENAWVSRRMRES